MKKKYTRIEQEADGKREYDYGKEELQKDPKKKKKRFYDDGVAPLDEKGRDGEDRVLSKSELVARWELIKKRMLNNETAFLDLGTAAGVTQVEEQLEQEGEEGDIPPEMMEEGAEEQPQEEGELSEHEEEGAQEASEALQEGASPEEIVEMLRADGFSDAEITHIMDGVMHDATDPVQQKKIEHMDEQHKAKIQDSEHKRQLKEREHELELEHKKRMSDLEYESQSKRSAETDMELEHKKRMLDLEYEKEKQMLDIEKMRAEKELELDLKMKEKEMNHKIQLKNKENQVKSQMKMEEHAKKQAESKNEGVEDEQSDEE